MLCINPTRLLGPSVRTIAILLLSFLPTSSIATSEWIQYPSSGFATMTHYTLPENFIAACGCTAASTHYPTAALNQMAFGSSTAYGPSCGRCFALTLLNTFLSDPPFYPDTVKTVVVKVTDLCPLSTTGWCNATASAPNSAGNYLNFDLAYPSSSIPDNFFPSNESYYGYTDFGVWNVSYQSVSCKPNWAGSKSAAALGSVTDSGDSVCCPADPTGNANDTCPSFSDKNGIPPNTQTSGSNHSVPFIGFAMALWIPIYLTIFPFFAMSRLLWASWRSFMLLFVLCLGLYDTHLLIFTP